MAPRLATACASVLAIPALIALSAPAAFAAWPHDPTVNVPLSLGSGVRQFEVAVSDGAGGIIAAWEDYRSGTARIYAQHVLADGSIAPGWLPDGNEVKSAFPTRALNIPSICTDGAGGAVIAWRETFSVTDHDVYAQRMSPGGVQLWGSAGVGIALSSYDQDQPRIASDGSGSTLVVWDENHSSDLTPTGNDVYANRVGPNGVIRLGTNGVIVCNATGDQIVPTLASDGAGGLDVAWLDKRGPATNAIFAERLDSTGVVHGGWTANGTSVTSGSYAISAPVVVGNSSGGLLLAWSDDRNGAGTQDVFAQSLLGSAFQVGVISGSTVCNATGAQTGLLITADGSDGAFVAWADSRAGASDVYAEHLTSSASIASGWPVAGVALPVFTGTATQTPQGIVSDGVGGCIIAMFDNTAIRGDIYAAHLTSTGAMAEGWSAQVPVCTAINDQFAPICVSDDAAGAILTWQDTRNGNAYDLYAQRIDKWGKLGNAEPSIIAVKDVLNDQGGSVRVSWGASYLDAYPGYAIGSYDLWRQVPSSTALAALRTGSARLLPASEAPDAARGRALRASSLGGQTVYWEFVTSQIASGFPSYSLVAATASDSTPSSNPGTVFMVEAQGAGHEAWDSAPDTGYSVDNLAPPAPAPFAASYAAGVTSLHWSPPRAPDLAGYRLYRGSSSGFVPGPASLIGTPADTAFTDDPGGFFYYKVSAVDVHGNESPTSLAFPSGTTEVAPGGPHVLELAGSSPNPLRAGGTIRWSQSRDGPARLAIVDLAGRRVRSLVNALEPAGGHVARWDLRDDAGQAVASGIYFAVLDAEGHRLRARIAVLR